ncbi:hypothetical protein Srufu_048680 [Streptomyces libani subsp. rufus]|nr:hypothetical protein Srufu_048680 [Streptomyces libani subsp. rufus]
METFVLEELRYGGRAGGAGHALSMRRTGAGGLRRACRDYTSGVYTQSLLAVSTWRGCAEWLPPEGSGRTAGRALWEHTRPAPKE